MFLLMSVLILTLEPCGKCSASGTGDTAGSILFYKHRVDRECWSPEELAKLKARRIFENISLPVVAPPEKIDSKYIRDSVKYFRKALRLAENTDGHTTPILKEAVADAIGGHLQSKILPNVRLAYYAGYVPYRSVRHIHKFFEEVKSLLNTQGLGWRPAPRIPTQENIAVKKVIIGRGKLSDPCAILITKRDVNGCIHLPCPKLDEDSNPSAIALPFKFGGLVSLTSPNAENVILKYYTAASRCILNNSPEKCRHPDFVSFNNDLQSWLKKEVAHHLVDDKLYAAFGGVLRVASAVQDFGNGVPSRRKIREYEYDYVDEQPTLMQSHVISNSEWSPHLYVGVILAAALLILLLQMSYNYIFGSRCSCVDKICPTDKTMKEDEQPLLGNQVSYRQMTSNIPRTIMQPRASVPHSSGTSTARSSHITPEMKSKQDLALATRTQRVYDFNEKTEKMMSVIMSDYEESAASVATTATTSESDTCGTKESAQNTTIARTKNSTGPKQDRTKASAKTTRQITNSISRRKPSSPPKIPAPIAELKLEKSSRSLGSGVVPMYSTSSISRSEITYRTKGASVRESEYTGSGSTSSIGSASSVSSQSQSQSHTRLPRMSNRSRDIAWARRVISHTSRRDAATKSHATTGTGTEIDFHSFTTPPAKR